MKHLASTEKLHMNDQVGPPVNRRVLTLLHYLRLGPKRVAPKLSTVAAILSATFRPGLSICSIYMDLCMIRLLSARSHLGILLLASLLLGALHLTLAPDAHAQRIIRRATPAGVDSSQTMRFQLADSYFRAGQFDRAVSLLEDLYDSSPETYVFFDKLKQTYENVKRYDDAIMLVERHAARQGTTVELLAEKARLIYLKGDETAALAAWDHAITGSIANPNRYRIVYNSMIEVRLFDQAARVLEQGREDKGQPDLYQNELAYLYSLNGEHEKAMAEYLSVLAENEKRLSYVINRLTRFTDQSGTLSKSIPVAEQAVREAPLNRAYRELLGWLYVEAEQYDKALDTYRAIDRLEQEQGRVLFAFAKRAADADAYAAARDAYDEVLKRYPDAPTAPDARIGLGEMHQRWAESTFERTLDSKGNRAKAPHYEKALEAYRTFLQDYPNHRDYPEVLSRIATLQLDVFFNLGEAETTLNEILQRYASADAATRARYDLGRIALARGNLDAAQLAFSRLVDELRLGELAEQARYELALIHFYRGEFDASKTLASVLDENTSTDVANDAIELKVLLTENKGPDSLNTPLKAYAVAALQQRQRQPDQVIQTLDAWLDSYGQHPLADDARFLRAQAFQEAGRTDDALAAFGELPLIHPRSPLADRSLFQAAEILAFEREEPDEALNLYTKILTTYPGSLLIPEVRLRIRTLRGDES